MKVVGKQHLHGCFSQCENQTEDVLQLGDQQAMQHDEKADEGDNLPVVQVKANQHCLLPLC